MSGKGEHEPTSAAAGRIKGGVTMITSVPSTHISLSPHPQPEDRTGHITLRDSLLTYVSAPKGP